MFVDCVDRNYQEISEFDYFVVDYLTQFSRWYLTQRLKIPLAKVLELRGRAAYFDRAFWNGNFSRKPFWAPATLESLAVWSSEYYPGPSRKILLTRSGATKRRIINLDETVKLIEELGFSPIDTGNYSVTEQIEAFLSVEVVVAPIGSDLFNLAFCRPGTKVVCLVNKEYYTNSGDNVLMLRSLCALRSLFLTFLLCEGRGGLHDDDLLVNNRDLKDFFELRRWNEAEPGLRL
jgi:hypothetical protein